MIDTFSPFLSGFQVGERSRLAEEDVGFREREAERRDQRYDEESQRSQSNIDRARDDALENRDYSRRQDARDFSAQRSDISYNRKRQQRSDLIDLGQQGFDNSLRAGAAARAEETHRVNMDLLKSQQTADSAVRDWSQRSGKMMDPAMRSLMESGMLPPAVSEMYQSIHSRELPPEVVATASPQMQAAYRSTLLRQRVTDALTRMHGSPRLMAKALEEVNKIGPAMDMGASPEMVESGVQGMVEGDDRQLAARGSARNTSQWTAQDARNMAAANLDLVKSLDTQLENLDETTADGQAAGRALRSKRAEALKRAEGATLFGFEQPMQDPRRDAPDNGLATKGQRRQAVWTAAGQALGVSPALVQSHINTAAASDPSIKERLRAAQTDEELTQLIIDVLQGR